MQKKLFIILSAVIFALSVTIGASAASVVQKPYTTYTFSYADGKEQTATSAYVASTVIYGEDLNVGTFKNPNDIFVNRQNECYYIADTDNNRILTINKENKCTNILDEFDNNGRKDSLSSPTGLFVDESGYLFVADSGNGRVLKFDGNYRVVKEC